VFMARINSHEKKTMYVHSTLHTWRALKLLKCKGRGSGRRAFSKVRACATTGGRQLNGRREGPHI
jgi:hypothetical protein